MSDVKISELDHLPGTFTDIDDLLIPIDDGQRTYCVTVEEFNEKGTESAYNYSQIAADAAGDAMTYKNNAAASASSAATAVIQATNAKTSAETAESNALAYKNAAESAKNDAIAAKNAINTAGATCTAAAETATAAATAATSAKELAQTAASTASSKAMDSHSYALDSEAWAVGNENGEPVTPGDYQYHNNSKYYAEQAASSAFSASSDAQTCATSVVKTPYIGANGHWFVWSWETQAFVDTNVNATGAAGNGIVSTTKTSTSGKVDTYTILYTNGDTDTFTVTNGEDGQGSGDMLMTDYDHDQDVFNAGGIPSYVSGAISAFNTNTVTPGLATKMNTDGSNSAAAVDMKASLITGSSDITFTVGSISKAAGDNENVSLVNTYSGSEADVYDRDTYWTAFYKSHIGDLNVYYTDNDEDIYVVIDSVSQSYTYDQYGNYNSVTVTATAHLKEDISSAISLTSVSLNVGNYISGSGKDYLLNGQGVSIKGNSGRICGSHSYIDGDNCAIDGQYNAIKASDSFVSGRQCIVGGNYSHVSGANNIAMGAYASVEGFANYVSQPAYYTHVGGRFNKATHDDQTVVGKYNDSHSNTLLEVGNGTADNARSNAFEVYSDGCFSQNNGTDKYKFAKYGGVDGFYDGSGTFHPLVNLYLEQSVTLSTSADTTVTFTNAGILTTSRIDPYSSDYTIVPINVVAANGSCTVTFKKASTASTITVGIEVKN